MNRRDKKKRQRHEAEALPTAWRLPKVGPPSVERGEIRFCNPPLRGVKILATKGALAEFGRDVESAPPHALPTESDVLVL